MAQAASPAKIGPDVPLYYDPLDVRRKASRRISFGYGAHFCLGAPLARLEGRIALAGTLARFPRWEIDPAELVPVPTTTVRGYSSVPIHLGR
jgi:cytochrome P450